MAKDKLIVKSERDYRHRIYWFIAEEQDTGACVGERGDFYESDTAPENREDWECWTVSKAVSAFIAASGHGDRDSTGFYFETETQAKAAIKWANIALRQERDLPEWAATALEQGWKPPKGWKA